VSDADRRVYESIVSPDLSDEQRERIVTPARVYDGQRAVLAVHWHPEFVPMELIRERIARMFPNRQRELIIPTQHNVLMEYDGYAGTEVDCYSHGFNLKVQLLIHFEKSRVAGADVFRSMLAHTFRYRQKQLFEFIDSVVDPEWRGRLATAAVRTRADNELVEFVAAETLKLKRLLVECESVTPPDAIRNKLLSSFVLVQTSRWDERRVAEALALLGEVKRIVKETFSTEFFYATEEVIEEVRGLGGGIVVPHPEQFWPILLAEYDVDGYEVWNPQSRQYTEFLIHVVSRQNKTRRRGRRPLLIFMGDDCHVGEKAKEPRFQEADKAGREIGVQPAWDDLAIRKGLIVAGADRRSVIEDYRSRLGS